MVIDNRTRRTSRAPARGRVRAHVAIRSAARGLDQTTEGAPVVCAPGGGAGAHPRRAGPANVEVWGRDSFPASDAPANW